MECFFFSDWRATFIPERAITHVLSQENLLCDYLPTVKKLISFFLVPELLKKNFFMNRLSILPEEVLFIIWKLCFSHVLEDLMTKYHWKHAPTKFFFQKLKYNTRIRYLSDYGWQTGIYKGLSVTSYFNKTPFYYINNVSCMNIVNPLRPISLITLRHVDLQKKKKTRSCLAVGQFRVQN